MKAVARAWDATLNDVALAILDAGINRYLRAMRAALPTIRSWRSARSRCTTRREAGDDATSRRSGRRSAPSSAPIDKRLRPIMANTRAAKDQLKSLGKDAAYAYAVMAFAMSETLDDRAAREARARNAAGQRADLERARAGGDALPERREAGSILPGVHADRRRGAQRDVHVLRRPGDHGLHGQWLGTARGREPGEVHAGRVRRARDRRRQSAGVRRRKPAARRPALRRA